ncbi:MAG: ankyrin repeat domain-containing protein [Planctomycetota bacterium]
MKKTAAICLIVLVPILVIYVNRLINWLTPAMSLQEAGYYGEVKEAELNLFWGSDINGEDEDGATALHLAAKQGRKELAELLIARGADVDAGCGKQNKDPGMTPLHFALQAGQKDLAKLLVANGADVNSRCYYGYMPLGIAALQGNKDMVEFLISSGATVTRNDGGGSHLFDAAEGGNRDIAVLLIAKGARVSEKNRWHGRTPLHHAWHLSTAELLIEEGADVNAKDLAGQSPLHRMALGGHKAVAELLIKNGANVNARDNQGRSPLDLAKEGGHEEVIALLVANGANQ